MEKTNKMKSLTNDMKTFEKLMQEQRKAYEDGLQKILTTEQYEAYQKDREAMRGRMSSRGRGPRQNENAKDAGSRARSKTTR